MITPPIKFSTKPQHNPPFLPNSSWIIDLTLVNIHILQSDSKLNSFNGDVGLDFQAQSNRCSVATKTSCKEIFLRYPPHGKRMGNKYILNTHRPSRMMHFSQNQPLAKCFQWFCHERIDCKASCCCGCKDDQVEAKVAGGKVCWSCLSRFTIRLAVCSVARSLPHRTYKSIGGSLWLLCFFQKTTFRIAIILLCKPQKTIPKMQQNHKCCATKTRPVICPTAGQGTNKKVR